MFRARTKTHIFKEQYIHPLNPTEEARVYPHRAVCLRREGIVEMATSTRGGPQPFFVKKSIYIISLRIPVSPTTIFLPRTFRHSSHCSHCNTRAGTAARWTAQTDIAAGKMTSGNEAGAVIDTGATAAAAAIDAVSLRPTAAPTAAAGGGRAAGTGDAAEAEAGRAEAEEKGDVCLRVDANTQ